MKTRAPLTAADLLRVGSWFERDSHLFEVTTWDSRSPLRVEARPAETDARQVFTLTELFAPTTPTRFAATRAELEAAPVSGVVPNMAVDAATLPAHLLKRAHHIIQTVEAVQAQLAESKQRSQVAADAFSLTECTRQACQALPSPVSLSAYYAYRRLYQAAQGDRALIASGLRRTTFGKTRISANAQHFVDTLIRRFYRASPPVRAQTVYAIALQVWEHNRHWWLNYQQTGDFNSADLIERLLDPRQQIDPLLSDPVQAQLWLRSSRPPVPGSTATSSGSAHSRARAPRPTSPATARPTGRPTTCSSTASPRPRPCPCSTSSPTTTDSTSCTSTTSCARCSGGSG